jgi:hypothetical protein
MQSSISLLSSFAVSNDVHIKSESSVILSRALLAGTPANKELNLLTETYTQEITNAFTTHW